MTKKILTTPIKDEDLADIKAGDIIYLNGHIVTCRDVAHRRLIEGGRELPVDVNGGAILHAGPIVRPIKGEDDKFEMVSVGPTTSMRMEKFEKEFIAKTGVKLIVGKGGMGKGTEEGCAEHKALHCVFPAGCAVVAAVCVEEIKMRSGAIWECRVKEFGPLIVSIDTHGNNLFEQNKVIFNQRKEIVADEICQNVSFIK